MSDIRDLSEGEIWEMLKQGEKVPYYPDISDPTRLSAIDSFGDILTQEKKLSRTLSTGIGEQKGFHGKTRTTDIVRELSKDIGIDAPKIEYAYKTGLAGWANSQDNVIGVNPQSLADYGREGVIAHELRHIKEGPQYKKLNIGEMDNSVRSLLYTEGHKTGNSMQDLLSSLHKSANFEGAVKKEQGKALNYFIPKKKRLFENDKLKYSVDALDAYDFLEKGHFKQSFLKKNLERVAKGLPIIGTAATIAGGIMSSDAGAAVIDGIVPGGVDGTNQSAEQMELDRKYKARVRNRATNSYKNVTKVPK